MKKDKEEYEELWRLSSLQDHVQYHSDLEFSVADGDLLIFDEADQYMYEEP